MDRFTGLIIQVILQTSAAHSVKLTQDDTDDLCADTFAELLKRDMATLRAFRGRCSLATYLAVVARRIVVRRLAEDRFRQAMGHVTVHQAALDYAAGKSGDVDRIDHRDEVESLMAKLPGDLRKVAVWFFVDQLGYREIAARLGRPLNSVGPMISRIRERWLSVNKTQRQPR